MRHFLYFLFLSIFASVPVSANSINGSHKCQGGGTMVISGYNGIASTPTVTFKGKTYHLTPYTHPTATFLSFVDINASGTSLGVSARPFFVVEENGKVIDRCNPI